MSLRTLFIDLNAYFASVEQQERPELRNRPVVIVPTMAATGCCIAASYEAKRLGVKTGMLVFEAQSRCADLRVVESRPDLYVRYHHAIVAAVESCLHVTAVHSIDEMACRLMGEEREPHQARFFALQIKEALRRQIGDYVRCSIGIAPNRVLAKIACDMQKPDGLTTLRQSDLPNGLFSLDLIDLPGIGPRMRRRLERAGIETVEQLCTLSEKQLQKAWNSVLGSYWWHWLRGYDVPDLPTQRRSVGHSHVLPPQWRNVSDARAVLIRLIHRAAARLRNLGYWARRMDVYVSFLSKGRWHDHIGLGLCQDTISMVEAFALLWERRPPGTPFQVGVTLLDLVPDRSAPQPLFLAERRQIELSRIMDQLNARFGTNRIYLGVMHHVRTSAPPRIAFTHVPQMLPAQM